MTYQIKIGLLFNLGAIADQLYPGYRSSDCNYVRSQKIVGVELHEFLLDSSRDDKELPKKRWLREAIKKGDLSLEDHENNHEELALPLNWDEPVDSTENSTPSDLSCPAENLVIMENQNRPSVLVCLHDGKKKAMTNDEIQTAIALVELKNSGNCYSKCNYRV